MSVINLNKDNFVSEVINSDVPVLVDFFATWCAPCRTLSPVVDKIAEEEKNIKVCKVDIDEQRELAVRFNVASVPTLITFKNGNINKTSIGVKSKHEILSLLD